VLLQAFIFSRLAVQQRSKHMLRVTWICRVRVLTCVACNKARLQHIVTSHNLSKQS
jgi:hypothetical protein